MNTSLPTWLRVCACGAATLAIQTGMAAAAIIHVPGDSATIQAGIDGTLNCDGLLDLADLIMLGNVLDGLVDIVGTCAANAGDFDSDGDADEDDYNLLYDAVASTGP